MKFTYFKSNSIRRNLLKWMLVFLLPVLLIITFRSYFSTNYFANQANDRALFRVALVLAQQVELIKSKDISKLQNAIFGTVQQDENDRIYYQILDEKNHYLIGEKNLSRPIRMPKLNAHIFYNGFLQHEELRMVAFSIPIMLNQELSSVYILVGETTHKRQDMENEIVFFFFITQLIIFLITILAVNLAIKRGIVSLDRLRHLITSRLPSDTHPIKESSAPIELQPVISAMNDLVTRVNGSVEEKKHFIINAAHQLKTPLAGLKLQAEAALREHDLTSIHHALIQISHGSDNLARLTNQLLSLARAETTNLETNELSEVDLIKLAKNITAEWVPKALAAKIDLGIDCQLDTLAILGSETLLQELLNNLIDNAIRYNPANTSITVSISRHQHAAMLSVEDNGIGIPKKEQSKVFQRFYRVQDNSINGCGLGLAIVQEIARQHHAHVTLKFADEKKMQGTIVEVSFPLVKKPQRVTSNKI